MLNIDEIVKATNGKLITGELSKIPKNYEIDSREVKNGDFFIPLVGNNVDGHDFIIDSVKKGIVGFFINFNCANKDNIVKESKVLNPSICIIEVNDTLKALIKAGSYNRKKHIDIPIVAVTGSVGKTSTREMIASVLSQKYNILVTKKNYNSNIGVSIMCLLIDNQETCVFEAGIDKFGEMEELSEIIKPDVVVFTVIGTSHIGTFKTKENIFNEKLKLTNYIKGLKKVVTNSDDEYLSKVSTNEKYDVVKISIDNVGNIVSGEDYLKFSTYIYNEKLDVKINQIGNHNIYNAIMAIKVGEIFKISKKDIINGVLNYKNFVGRMQKNIINGITLVDDTYNASSESMKSGLITINKLNSNRKFAVLGDMFDLGDLSDKLHTELGNIFSKVNYDYLYTLGDKIKLTAKEAKKYMDDKHVKSFNNRDDLIKELLNIVKYGDIIYFKASNGMKFTQLYKDIENKLEKM